MSLRFRHNTKPICPPFVKIEPGDEDACPITWEEVIEDHLNYEDLWRCPLENCKKWFVGKALLETFNFKEKGRTEPKECPACRRPWPLDDLRLLRFYLDDEYSPVKNRNSSSARRRRRDRM